jgi:hypothetical protein
VAGLPTVLRTKEKIVYNVCYCLALACKKIEDLGSYVLEAQRSRKHEGEWPNKPGSQYQAWQIARRYNGAIKICASLGTIMKPLALFILPPPLPPTTRGQIKFIHVLNSLSKTKLCSVVKESMYVTDVEW